MREKEDEGEGTPLPEDNDQKKVIRSPIVLLPKANPNDGVGKMNLVYSLSRYFDVSIPEARNILEAMEVGLFCGNLDTRQEIVPDVIGTGVEDFYDE